MQSPFRIDTAVAINVCLARLEALLPCQKLRIYGSCETDREFVDNFFNGDIDVIINYSPCIYII